MTNKKDEPEVKEVEPEVFDELVDSGEYVEEPAAVAEDDYVNQASPPNPPWVDNAPENGSVPPEDWEFHPPGNAEDEAAIAAEKGVVLENPVEDKKDK